MSETILTTAEQLDAFAAAAAEREWLAIDTEFMRESTYLPALCLVQIGDERGAVCIDPLAIDDLSALHSLLANPNIVKILHSCRQDLEALNVRMGGLEVRNVFDTQVAAAFCGYGGQPGYAMMVTAVCDVFLPKEQTRTDWAKRPLTPEQVQYALDDVAYLSELRSALTAVMQRRGCLEWHREECERIIRPELYATGNEDGATRIKGMEKLDAEQQACARRLAIWRERKAARHNRPRGWIVANEVLLQLARIRPSDAEGLARTDMARKTIRRMGGEILAVIADPAAFTVAPVAALNKTEKRHVRGVMKMVHECAKQKDIHHGLLATRQEAESFVRGDTDLPLFHGWRKELLGDEVLARFG